MSDDTATEVATVDEKIVRKTVMPLHPLVGQRGQDAARGPARSRR